MSATQLIDALIKNHKSARTLAHIQDQNIRQGWYIKSATNKTNSQQRTTSTILQKRVAFMIGVLATKPPSTNASLSTWSSFESSMMDDPVSDANHPRHFPHLHGINNGSNSPWCLARAQRVPMGNLMPSPVSTASPHNLGWSSRIFHPTCHGKNDGPGSSHLLKDGTYSMKNGMGCALILK